MRRNNNTYNRFRYATTVLHDSDVVEHTLESDPVSGERALNPAYSEIVYDVADPESVYANFAHRAVRDRVRAIKAVIVPVRARRPHYVNRTGVFLHHNRVVNAVDNLAAALVAYRLNIEKC